MVAHTFLEERLRTTTIVDEQLRRLRARSFSAGDIEQPLSLLRLETSPPATPKRPGEAMREVPTSPRPFLPTTLPARSEPGSNRGVWIAGAAIVLLLAALAVFYVR